MVSVVGSSFQSMNAADLLQCAPRLSESNRAYVTLDNGGRGIIVPPGAFL